MKVLITGASSGIGKDMAICFAKRRFDLVLVARDEQKLNKISDELKQNYNVNIEIFSMDLSIEENCKKDNR